MLHEFRCPSCGHKLRVPEDRLGREVRCQACNEAFAAARGRAVSRTEEVQKDEEPAPSLLVRLGKKTGAEKAVVLEGAIGAALAGIVVGVLVGAIAGGSRQATNEALGGTVGGVISGIFFGFIIGFGAGTLIGGLIGASGKLFGLLFTLTARRAAVLGGLLTGGAMALIVGNRQWAAVGVPLGGVASYLWSLVSSWAESNLNSTGHTTMEYLEDELEPRRLEIDDGSHTRYPQAYQRRRMNPQTPHAY